MSLKADQTFIVPDKFLGKLFYIVALQVNYLNRLYVYTNRLHLYFNEAVI
jgi:hypothetical protein